MKNALRISLLLIALLFLLAWRFAPARQAPDEPELSGEVRRPDAAVPDHTRTLRVLHGGAVEEMTMDEYLLGVLRAEMPASFELEALKAQAVAARTYTLHKMSGRHCAPSRRGRLRRHHLLQGLRDRRGCGGRMGRWSALLRGKARAGRGGDGR